MNTAFRVELGQFGIAFASNSLADCIARANEYASVGRKAVVRSVADGRLVYQNWTPNAATSEGRRVLADNSR